MRPRWSPPLTAWGAAEDVGLADGEGAAAAEAESEAGHPLAGRQRSTLCVSSQVGCQMGCTFCATGGRPRPCVRVPRCSRARAQRQCAGQRYS